MRRLLDEHDVASFPKTTGSRGIHIYARLVPEQDSYAVRAAAVAVARELERRRPDLITAAWWKEERGERVFIDFNQNAPHKTVFGAWSVRAYPEAPVSMPFRWDELDTVEPRRWTIADAPARLAAEGDAWAEMYDAPQSICVAAGDVGAGHGGGSDGRALAAGVPEAAERTAEGRTEPREEGRPGRLTDCGRVAWPGSALLSHAPMGNMCEGRVAIVTGAGRGIGREHALMMASEGAKVVVNDVGGSRDGAGHSEGPAHDVVAEIEAMGGQAAANGDDISSWDGAGAVVKQAIDTFGGLDIVVNNAGILRDRMLVNMTEEEWDAVIKVHLKGTFGVSRFAAAYWRERSKNGETNVARIINTTSPSGIYGNAGQTNYGAAKAGIATFTVIAAMELERYGITVNAIAPTALTRMTEDLGLGNASEEAKAAMDPRWIAPLCTWLASPQSNGVTGQVFEVSGGWLAVAEGWHRGPSTQPVDDPSEVDAAIRPLLAQARAGSDMFGNENRPALKP